MHWSPHTIQQSKAERRGQRRGFRHALEPSNISTIKSGEGRGGRGRYGERNGRNGLRGPQTAPPKSIMSNVLPNTPFPKSKERIGRNKGAHHEHQQGLAAEKPATKRPRSYMEGPRGGKTNCKKPKKTYMEGCFP